MNYSHNGWTNVRGQIRSDRTTPCPNCGTIATHTHLGPLLKTLVVASVLFVALLCLIYVDVDTSSPTSSSPRRGGGQYVRLRQALAYLSEIEEVQWYECEDNNVYVGFEPIPNDWQMIVKGAAVRGNEAIEFGCHVWAVPANKHGWRPGDSSFLGEATARHSRISDTSWDD